MRIVNDAVRHPGSCWPGGSSIAAPPVMFDGTQVLALWRMHPTPSIITAISNHAIKIAATSEIFVSQFR